MTAIFNQNPALNLLSDEITILLIAMLPVFELRGAIPVAMAMGMPPGKALVLGIMGSILPAIPILLYLAPITALLRQTLLRPLVNWWLQRGLRKSKHVRQYRWLALFLFVAVPLPTTGVWTGSLIASILGMGLRQALPPIIMGTMVAGVLVVTLAYNLPWFFV